MVDSKLLQMLRCPIDGSPLVQADAELLKQLNAAIERGELRDAQDQPVSSPLDEGLVNATAGRLYPVRGGIPSLIADEAIEVGGEKWLDASG